MSRINVFVIPALPRTRTRLADREQQESHTVYLVRSYFVRNEGNLQIPVMGRADDSKECAVVQVSSPCGIRYVEWVAARDRLMPEVPDMDPVDKNEVLAGWMISPVAPHFKIDGKNYEFFCQGVYAYYLKKPPSKRQGLPLGRNPYDGGAAQTLREQNFSQHWRG